MSSLNLGLQNVSLERSKMNPEFEMQAKSLNSLQAIRNAAKRNPSLKNAYVSSMENPLSLIMGRFQKLKWTGEHMDVDEAATADESKELSTLLHVIDPAVNLEDNNTWKSAELQTFLDRHERKRHYMYQLKKFRSDTCFYCFINPPRIPDHLFEDLHFLPDPVVNGEDFAEFADTYRVETDDSARPSVKDLKINSERDQQFKNIMVATKVRGFVLCPECGKRRVVYSAGKLTSAELRSVSRLEEELIHLCGDPLFHAGIYKDKIVVKGLSCSSPIEASYYSAKTMLFDDICFYCVDTEVVDDDDVIKLKEEFGIVRSICEGCKAIKPVKTRQALKTK